MLHWLCLSRSRSAAARACREGRVTVEGSSVRPSQPVRIGQTVEIVDYMRRRRIVVRLLSIPERQVSRKDSRSFYEVLREEHLSVED